MNFTRALVAVASVAAVFATHSVAQDTGAVVRVGTDSFVAGPEGPTQLATPGDAFVSGAMLVLRGTVGADLHVAGFDVDIEAPVADDLYAAGATVTVFAPVGGDLTAAAMSLRIAPDARVGENARLVAGQMTIEGPIDGALIATGGTIVLDAQVAGDAMVTADSLTFGEGARIGGILSYSAPKQISIPSAVASADRIRYRGPSPAMAAVSDLHEFVKERSFDRDDWGPSRAVKSAGLAVGAFALVFALVVGALGLMIVPDRVETARAAGAARPGRALWMGALVLAALMGTVPVLGLSLVGLPLVPVAMVAIILAWLAGYLLGVYQVAARAAVAFGFAPVHVWQRIALVSAGVALGAVLNFIPVLGWLVNFGVLLLGLGAITLGALAAAQTSQAVAAP